MADADVTRLCKLDLNIGKGRQVMKCMHRPTVAVLSTTGVQCYNGCRACEICALESSCLCMHFWPYKGYLLCMHVVSEWQSVGLLVVIASPVAIYFSVVVR